MNISKEKITREKIQNKIMNGLEMITILGVAYSPFIISGYLLYDGMSMNNNLEEKKANTDKVLNELVYEYIESSEEPSVLFDTTPEGYEIYSIETITNDDGKIDYKIGYINNESIEYDINISGDDPVVLRKSIKSN